MPHYIYESRYLKTNIGPLAGVDEAGRGPLAGPVVAAGCTAPVGPAARAAQVRRRAASADWVVGISLIIAIVAAFV